MPKALAVIPSASAKDKTVKADNAVQPVTVEQKFATLRIPHLELRPTISDFIDMQPGAAFVGKMLKVDGFLQRDPKDGSPVSNITSGFLPVWTYGWELSALVYPAEKTWHSNHGPQGTLGVPSGHNQSFSDGHAEWFAARRFPRTLPTDPYPKPLWNSGWPWSWSWVEL